MTNIKTKLEKILPQENILSEEEELYVYSQDSANIDVDSKLPDVVVFPQNVEQVQEIIKLANEYQIPVIARGAGTNMVGACVSLCGGIILNMSKMNKILEINPDNMTVKVQSGVVVGDLIREVEKAGLFYPPDPSNLKVSTIGGSIALNSGGAKSFKYGTTKDYIVSLKVVLANGDVITTGSNTTKNSTGYQLQQFFVGSEGTLGIVVEATLKLVTKPESSKLVLAYFENLEDAVKSVNSIISNKLCPSTLDLMDKKTLETVEDFCPTGLLTQYEAALLLEVDGFECSLSYQQERISEICKSCNAKEIIVSKSKEQDERIWTARRSAFGACAKLKPNVQTGDVVVPRNKIPELVNGIRQICAEKNLIVSILGHIGDGNIHPHIPIDLNNKVEVENYEKAKDEIHMLAIKLGGTLSGEHGIGCEKSKYMQYSIDEVTLNYMKTIKKLFDPKNILNPNKIFEL